MRAPQRGLLLALVAACVRQSLGDGLQASFPPPLPANGEGTTTPAVTIHIATTACGAEAAEDVIPLLKSIAIHASPENYYQIHVFMNNHTEFPFIQARQPPASSTSRVWQAPWMAACRGRRRPARIAAPEHLPTPQQRQRRRPSTT